MSDYISPCDVQSDQYILVFSIGSKDMIQRDLFTKHLHWIHLIFLTHQCGVSQGRPGTSAPSWSPSFHSYPS